CSRIAAFIRSMKEPLRQRVVSRSPASDVYRPHVLDESCARRETALDGLNQVDLVEHGSRSAELNPLPRGQNGVTRHLQRDDLSMQLYLTQSLRRHEFRFLDRKIWACDDVALRGHTSSGCDSGLDRGVGGGNTGHWRLTFGVPALNLLLEGIRDRWEIFHLESTEHAWIDSEDDSGGERAGLEKQRPALDENLKVLETRQRHQKIPLRRAGGIAAQGRARHVALIISSDKPGRWGDGRSQSMTFRESLGISLALLLRYCSRSIVSTKYDVKSRPSSTAVPHIGSSTRRSTRPSMAVMKVMPPSMLNSTAISFDPEDDQ